MSPPGSNRLDRAIAAGLLIVAGLGIAAAHWLGVLVGAALLSQLARSVRGGIAYGAAFGLLTVGAFFIEVVAYGQLDRTIAMGELAILPIAIGIGLGIVGGLTRGLR